MSNAGKFEQLIDKRANIEKTNALLKRQRNQKNEELARLNERMRQLGNEIRNIDRYHSENVDEFIRLGQELKELEAKNNIYTPG